MRLFRKILALPFFGFAGLLVLAAVLSGGGDFAIWILAGLSGLLGKWLWPSAIIQQKEVNFDDKSHILEASPKKRGLRSKAAAARWYAERETVSVQGRDLQGLVYVGQDKSGRPWRSTIDPDLNAAPASRSMECAGLSYWPSYFDMTPRQRGAYLDWLADGCVEHVDIGLVFVYFYGLERRAFADEATQDHPIIADEVRRLLGLFGENHSFKNYAGRLLDTIDGIVAIKNDQVPVAPAYDSPPTGWEFPLDIRCAIGRKLETTDRLDGPWMLAWYLAHPDRGLRTPGHRAFDLLTRLFLLRFDKAHPNGLKVARPKTKNAFAYQPASNDFSAEIKVDIADVANLTKPLNAAQKIVDECEAELDSYSRFLGRNPDAAGTVRALALLPDALRDAVSSPTVDAFRSWLDSKTSGKFGAVNVGALCDRLEVSKGKSFRVPKGSMRVLAETLNAVGYGMAPEADISGYTAKPEEPVIIFKRDAPVVADFGAAYALAMTNATLAVSVAVADGAISSSEIGTIARSISNNPNLTRDERLQLTAFVLWLTQVTPPAAKLNAALKNLDAPQRELLADSAIAVAAADGEIDPDEVKILERVFDQLSLPKTDVYARIHGAVGPTRADGLTPVRAPRTVADEAVPSAPSKPGSIPLDASAVERIRRETESVSSVLADVFASEEPSEESAAGDGLPDALDKPRDPQSRAGLDKRHASLLAMMSDRPAWSAGEYKELCSQFGLYPAGATETLNEWSFDLVDEPVIEDGAKISVNVEILKELEAA